MFKLELHIRILWSGPTWVSSQADQASAQIQTLPTACKILLLKQHATSYRTWLFFELVLQTESRGLKIESYKTKKLKKNHRTKNSSFCNRQSILLTVSKSNIWQIMIWVLCFLNIWSYRQIFFGLKVFIYFLVWFQSFNYRVIIFCPFNKSITLNDIFWGHF